ncbi:hypothetical protein T03_18193 [Trichinella britovi]|uniref:Uncharacterized protein n=1 Tax=Trichinella britovi TaxID=45882 RepID=A0A0V1C6C4_TRIBR|nr:hypothetical protein T03_18193 [Trichinella britovi]
MARSARSYSRSRSRSSTRRSMSSRRGSHTRPRRRPISRIQTPKRSTRQILVPSSRLKLLKKPSAVQLDGGEAPSEIISPTCLQSLRSRSRSKSVKRKKTPGKKVARKVAQRPRSKSGRKSVRNKKRSVKKSNQKAVLIKASKSRRKRSSLKSIPKQKRYSLRNKKYATKHWTVGYSLFSSNRLTAELKVVYYKKQLHLSNEASFKLHERTYGSSRYRKFPACLSAPQIMERSRSTILYFLREGSVVFQIDDLNNHARKDAHKRNGNFSYFPALSTEASPHTRTKLHVPSDQIG